MRRALALLLLSLVPSSALAQTSPGSDVDAWVAEVDRDYAQALGNDCPLACRALESMRRATDRLCSMDPGERCARARRKVEDATAHVRTSCPSCPTELGGERAAAPPAPSPAPPTETVATEESVQRRGGCGGCTTARAPLDAIEALALGAMAVLALQRRRRRR